MRNRGSAIQGLALAALLAVGGTAFHCEGLGLLWILSPAPQQLSQVGDVEAAIELRGFVRRGSLRVELDGADVTGLFSLSGRRAEGVLPAVAAGEHELRAIGRAPFGREVVAVRSFEVVDLAIDPDCEFLNDAECLLPYPSDFFRRHGADGYELAFAQQGIPTQKPAKVIPASEFAVRDGFSPTVQVLMNFPGGVDVEASGLPRLLPDANRSTDLTSLASDSPSVLLELPAHGHGRGRRVLHWTENDVRAADPARRVFFLRPGRSLLPGHRYIVALRHLVDDAGEPVEPGLLFEALRDRRPTTLPEVEARRAHFEEIFHELRRAGVPRHDLVLAFDFTVASDENLTGQMLSMRDQAFAWLADQDQAASPTFQVDEVEEHDCAEPGQHVWREVRGTYRVPLFLDSDPESAPLVPGKLQVGPDGFTPVWTTTTDAPFGIAVPCAARQAPVPATVIGHGLFGNGPNFAIDINGLIDEADARFGIGAPAVITGGTNWRGLSDPDFDSSLAPSFIVNSVVFDLPNFAALPDRLRQGQLNQLVLARMMTRGLFNADPAFQAPAGLGGHGVFQPDGDTTYFGISLGGIMGLMFAALSPDVERLNTDVPSINFSLLLQRATPFILFQTALDVSVSEDPMVQILGLQLLHELWVTGESAGYATHITENPLPGTPPKQILMTMAYLDQQVSNQATEITARTLKLPQLEGSFLPGLPLIPDEPGPLPSALVVYDTGSLDPDDPFNAPFIPPLANEPATPNGCDPHARRVTIPASFLQLAAFLEPGGQVENFCDGLCDADPAAMGVGPEGPFALELPFSDRTCPPVPE